MFFLEAYADFGRVVVCDNLGANKVILSHRSMALKARSSLISTRRSMYFNYKPARKAQRHRHPLQNKLCFSAFSVGQLAKFHARGEHLCVSLEMILFSSSVIFLLTVISLMHMCSIFRAKKKSGTKYRGLETYPRYQIRV